MENNNYNIYVQCTDKTTGVKGTFIGKDSAAVSPIFDSLFNLYPWMKENGWKSESWNKNRPWGAVPPKGWADRLIPLT